MNVASNVDRTVLKQNPVRRDFFNTFLAFKDSENEEDRDFVWKCIAEIPFENWELEDEDLTFISSLKGIKIKSVESLDSFHRSVFDRYKNAFECEKPAEVDSKNITIQLNRLKHSPNAYEEAEIVETGEIAEIGNRPGWSRGELFDVLLNRSEEFGKENWKVMESSALSTSDSVLHSYVLAFAIKNDLPINSELWMEKVRKELGKLSFGLLCLTMAKPWNDLTDVESAFIDSSLIRLGLGDSSPFNLVNQYKAHIGLKRFVVECIVRIDLKRFAQFPLFETIFWQEGEVKDKFDDVLETLSANSELQFEALAIFTRILLRPPPLLVPRDLPIGIPHMDQYFHVQIEPWDFCVVDLGHIITEKLITFCEKCTHLDFFLFFMLFSLNLNSAQYKRLLTLVKGSEESTRARMIDPHLNIHADLLSSQFEVSSRQRPSYTLVLLSLLKSPNCPQIDDGKMKKIMNMLPHVFLELVPDGFQMFVADERLMIS
jgi:hypothetical protein